MHKQKRASERPREVTLWGRTYGSIGRRALVGSIPRFETFLRGQTILDS